MANFQIEFFSNALNRTVPFKLFLPNDFRADDIYVQNEYHKRPTKTLFILHGYTGNAENWQLEELAKQYNFALVMPNGENAFYLDGMATGHKYATFLGEELVNYVRKTFQIAMKPEDTFITGLSMGGFGALHTGLAYPQSFGKIGAMSSALIVHEISTMKPGEDNGVANYDYYRECFGDLDQVLTSDANPETLVKKLKAQNATMPEIYMCCGSEDFLIENNRQFHQFLLQEAVTHEYYESPGIHDWAFWGTYAPRIVEWMFA